MPKLCWQQREKKKGGRAEDAGELKTLRERGRCGKVSKEMRAGRALRSGGDWNWASQKSQREEGSFLGLSHNVWSLVVRSGPILDQTQWAPEVPRSKSRHGPPSPRPASSRRDHSELGRRHASSTPGRCQWKRWGCTSHGLGSRLRGCARHRHRDLPPRSSKGGSRCSPARADPAFRRGGTRSLPQVAARPGCSRPRTPPGSPARNAAAGASVSGQGLSFSSWELTARRRSTPGSECPPPAL